MHKVLIVDDTDDNQYVMEIFFRFFGRNADIKLFFAHRGDVAFDIIREELPDLVFLDIYMETRDAGLVLARKVREEIKEKYIQLWALTATAMKGTADTVGDREKCLASGCDKYFSQPFDQKDMLIEVAEFLNIEIPNHVKERMGIG